MLETLLLRHSLHFTQLHLTPLLYTCRHFTSSRLYFTQLHFTTLSFGLTPFKFPTAPFHLTSLYFTSLHLTALLGDVRHISIPFISPLFIITFLTLFLKIVGLQGKSLTLLQEVGHSFYGPIFKGKLPDNLSLLPDPNFPNMINPTQIERPSQPVACMDFSKPL